MGWIAQWLNKNRTGKRNDASPIGATSPDPESGTVQSAAGQSAANYPVSPTESRNGSPAARQNISAPNSARPKATIFVDYEHWYYSLKNQYRMKPDPVRWRNRIAETYDIQKLYYFANFGDPYISAELNQIRQTSNLIIESGDGNQRVKKDMTDFIMLDAIYQNVDTLEDTDTYILFTGDGHFQSAVKYLRQRKGKKVIIYGIKQSMSRALSSLADECYELPFDTDVRYQHIQLILENFNNLAETKRGLYFPTFMKTVEVVSSRNDCNPDDIRAALGWLIQQGYVERYKTTVAFNNEISALKIHWDKLVEDHYWTA